MPYIANVALRLASANARGGAEDVMDAMKTALLWSIAASRAVIRAGCARLVGLVQNAASP